MKTIRTQTEGLLIYDFVYPWERLDFTHPNIYMEELNALKISDLIITPERKEIIDKLKMLTETPVVALNNPIDLKAYPKAKSEGLYLHMSGGSVIGSQFRNNLIILKKLQQKFSKLIGVIDGIKDKSIYDMTFVDLQALQINQNVLLGMRTQWKEYIERFTKMKCGLRTQFWSGNSRVVQEASAIGLPYITMHWCSSGKKYFPDLTAKTLPETYDLVEMVLEEKIDIDLILTEAYERVKECSMDKCKEALKEVIDKCLDRKNPYKLVKS